MIARKKQATDLCVPEGKGEHAIEPTDAIQSPLFIRVNDDFGIGMRSEDVPVLLQLLTKLNEIVDLAVEDDLHRVIFIRDRLSARSRR